MSVIYIHTRTHFTKYTETIITNSMRYLNCVNSISNLNTNHERTRVLSAIYTHTRTHFTKYTETNLTNPMRYLNCVNSISNLNTND